MFAELIVPYLQLLIMVVVPLALTALILAGFFFKL
jgi:nitrogen fixation-related uncharacterized protein